MKPIRRKKDERFEYPVHTKLTKTQMNRLREKLIKNDDGSGVNMSLYLRKIILASL